MTDEKAVIARMRAVIERWKMMGHKEDWEAVIAHDIYVLLDALDAQTARANRLEDEREKFRTSLDQAKALLKRWGAMVSDGYRDSNYARVMSAETEVSK